MKKDIMRRNSDSIETYEVSTEDGYILTLHRLPQVKPKGVIVLLHPITTDGIVFLLEGPTSPAIRFHNEGYDVWIPNHRGTPYSQKHINDDIRNYWNFGFHEIGIYDYSAIIQFIGEKTGRNDLVVIGHSMSSTSSLVYASLKPKEAEKYVKVFVLMSPTAYFQNLETPVQMVCPFNDVVENFLNKFQFHSLLTQEGYETSLIKFFATHPMKHLFIYFTDFLFGFTMDYEPAIFNNLLSNFPKSSSMKAFYHYAQICKGDGLFRMYDYKRTKNVQFYGSSVPPEYPVSNITVPIHLIASKADTCSTVKKEIIERHIGKGSSENHTVTTKDGYILTLFRIIRRNPRGVVILQHPVTCDGVVWVAQSNESLAFTLWNMGYEVWLPNHRGTHYSSKHVNLTTNDIKYWQFR
ncbi:unnamed protein product [Brassicogethes aeneus]|uniref:Lipase n=1 Tax=Brassicogethes aeneus TaxID=1431903 RepID=A0A9P0FFD7_BRAAE|nr:unnamed protein product [Brassicogethes aeneus]